MRAAEARIATDQAKIDNYKSEVEWQLSSVDRAINYSIKDGKNFVDYFTMLPEVVEELTSKGYTIEKMNFFESLKASMFSPYDWVNYRISW